MAGRRGRVGTHHTFLATTERYKRRTLPTMARKGPVTGDFGGTGTGGGPHLRSGMSDTTTFSSAPGTPSILKHSTKAL